MFKDDAKESFEYLGDEKMNINDEELLLKTIKV
jgi:hypothetical protein